MENWQTGLFILTAIAIGVGAQTWVAWLEHKRRTQALDIIRTALAAGKDLPPRFYEQLSQAGDAKAPWTEAIVFCALAIGFAVAFYLDGGHRSAYLVIAATMGATGLACLALALQRSGKSRHDDQG